MVPRLIPRDVIFGPAARQAPRLSPSGEHVAFLAPAAGAPNIWVASRRMTGARALTHRSRAIGSFRWTGDDRHLVYPADQDGDENTHLHVLDLASGESRDLTPFPGVRAEVVTVEADLPGTLLIQMDRRVPGRPDAYRADLQTGELTLAAENFGITDWIADHRLEVRGAVARQPGGGAALLIRDAEDLPWRTVYEVGYGDVAAFRPLGFTQDETAIYLISSLGAQASGLLRLDVATGAVQVIYEDACGHDVVGAHLHPVTGEPRIAVVQRQHRDLKVLNSSVTWDVAQLRGRCRGDVSLLGGDRDDNIWLIQDNADDAPTSFHLFNRRSGRLGFLFSHRPDLAQYQLASMEPFTVTARDGLVLHGYLTFPPEEERRDLPTVLAVHGGPWTRDVWGLRAEPQWLANRGYLCVNVNYRGSAGYGKDFVNAGDREWGGRMHDDLLDVVGNLVQRGIADPRRLGILGASYGGYAALVAAAFTPEVFQCAIASAAPSNLATFIAAIPPSWQLVAEELHRRVGHPVADAAFLWSRSPVSQVDQIRIPVLIAQGANDPRVRRSESEQIVAAMRQRGIAHEYLLFPDEGHGFARMQNKIAFYAAAERFLAEHLGGRYEPSPAAVGAIRPNAS
jgi:dipeptidyl aminopeptidase/acylaminoacyl peptidase